MITPLTPKELSIQRLTELRKKEILFNYRNYSKCGLPDDNWYELALSEHYMPVSEMDEAAMLAEITTLVEKWGDL